MSKRRQDRTVKTLVEERQHGRAFAQQHFAAPMARGQRAGARRARGGTPADPASGVLCLAVAERPVLLVHLDQVDEHVLRPDAWTLGKDRKSTRLNSSHVKISYAVFCLKKKKKTKKKIKTKKKNKKQKKKKKKKKKE